MILKRRKRERSGIKRVPEKRFPAHRAWVRGFKCAIPEKRTLWGKGIACDGPIEAAHARNGTDGGTSTKPHDKWCLSLCRAHHQHQTAIGERAFEFLYGINMKAIAEGLAARSPHRKGWGQAEQPAAGAG